MSKAEFFEKISTLLNTENIIQKDVNTFLGKKDTNNSHFKNKLEEMQNNYNKQQTAEFSNFKCDIQKANNAIQLFSRELNKPGPDLIQRIKVIMETIETQLTAIKSHQKEIYDSLLTSETSLAAEISLFDKNLNKYEHHRVGKFNHISKKQQSKVSTKHNLHPAIIEYDKYCAEHGPTEMWGEFEHQLFLKSFNASKSDDILLNTISHSLPMKSNEDILRHIAWYRTFRKLEDSKRDVLREWRHNKITKRDIPKDELDKNMTFNEIKTKKKELYEKEREERLAQLNAYKVQKELEKVLKEEEILKGKLAEKAKEEQQRKHAKLQKKKLLAYKEKKEMENEVQRAAKLAEEQKRHMQKKVSSSELLQLHQKNMKIIEKKQTIKQEKIIQEFEKQQKLEKIKSQVKVEVKNDPDRLFRKTMGQINREKDTSSSINPVVGSRSMPHRATPSWRQGL